jgi:hypothetical protein
MPRNKSHREGDTEDVRIYGVPKDLHNDLMAIKNRMGTSLSHMLKPQLRKFVESQPDYMKRPTSDEDED